MNGRKADAVDFNALTVDITELLQPGENEIRIETASSLNNRLLARGYYDRINSDSLALADNANNANVTGEGQDPEEEPADMAVLFNVKTFVRDYGLTGAVTVEPYRLEHVDPAEPCSAE